MAAAIKRVFAKRHGGGHAQAALRIASGVRIARHFFDVFHGDQARATS